MSQNRSYILCATPRSGSTLLCDLLLGSGVAGDPHSFYREEDIAEWAEHWQLPRPDTLDPRDFERRYLNAVLRAGTSANGVFGLRLMWASMPGLCARLRLLFCGLEDEAALMARAFGPPLFVHLSRRDKVAQAVSRLKAEQSGLWHRGADGSERERVSEPQAARYDGDRIAALVSELEGDDLAWDAFFARHRIEPLRLVYETLTDDPQAALAAILSALGLDPQPARAVPVRTARLADQASRQWAERFRAESGRGHG